MSPNLKSALKSAIVSAAGRKLLVTVIVAGTAAVGVTLKPEIADALSNVLIVVASAF